MYISLPSLYRKVYHLRMYRPSLNYISDVEMALSMYMAAGASITPGILYTLTLFLSLTVADKCHPSCFHFVLHFPFSAAGFNSTIFLSIFYEISVFHSALPVCDSRMTQGKGPKPERDTDLTSRAAPANLWVWLVEVSTHESTLAQSFSRSIDYILLYVWNSSCRYPKSSKDSWLHYKVSN